VPTKIKPPLFTHFGYIFHCTWCCDCDSGNSPCFCSCSNRSCMHHLPEWCKLKRLAVESLLCFRVFIWDGSKEGACLYYYYYVHFTAVITAGSFAASILQIAVEQCFHVKHCKKQPPSHCSCCSWLRESMQHRSCHFYWTSSVIREEHSDLHGRMLLICLRHKV